MAEFRRTIKCSNCGKDNEFNLYADITLQEIMVHGKCTNCGNSLQVNFNLVGDGASSQSSSSNETAEINIDQTLFEPEIPDNDIRDIIEG